MKHDKYSRFKSKQIESGYRTSDIYLLNSFAKRSKKNADVERLKKIVDINLDCPELIFRLLELEDLTNVAEANKQLKVAASLVFNNKYVN